MGFLIAGVILLAIILFFCIWIRVRVCYDEENGLRVVLRILFFSMQLYPPKPKKLRVKDYTPDAMRKRKEKERRKALDKKAKAKRKAAQKKNEKREQPNTKKSRGRTFRDILSLVKQLSRIVVIFVRKFFGRYLRVDIRRLCLTVATEDPAQTAILYGTVSTAVSLLYDFLEKHTQVRMTRHARAGIGVDFLSKTFHAEVDITLRLQIWHPFALLFQGIAAYLFHGRHQLKGKQSV